jgi:hypothetical protein
MASLLDTNRRVCEIQLSQILTFTGSTSFPAPEIARKHCVALRNRHRPNRAVTHFFATAPELKACGAAKCSSFISVTGSFATHHNTKDFAVDAIDLIMRSNHPVIWALNRSLGSRNDLTSSTELHILPLAIDVVKQITLQILQLNEHLVTERSLSLNSSRFQMARPEIELFSLLALVLMSVHCYTSLSTLRCWARSLPKSATNQGVPRSV